MVENNGLKPNQSKIEDYGSVEETQNAEQEDRSYTVAEALDYSGLGPGNLIPLSFAMMTQFGVGVEFSILPIIIPKLKCEWHLSSLFVVLIPITIIVSAMIGSLVSGAVTGKIGRVKLMIAGQFLAVIFRILSAFSQNIWQFLAFRAVMTFSLESSTCISAVYCIEMSPKSCRAIVQSLRCIIWALGSFSAAIVSYFILESLGWRILLFILVAPALIPAIALLFLRESPYYDITTNNVEEAQNTIDTIFRQNNTQSLPGVLKKHENAENPIELKLSNIPRDKNFIVESMMIVSVTTTAFAVFAFTVWVGPRIFNEGYCVEKFDRKTVTKHCHSYYDEALRELALSSTGEIFGIIILIGISIAWGRVISLRIGTIGTSLTLSFLLICGGRIKLLIDMFILRAINFGVFAVIMLYVNEYYTTQLRGLANGLCYFIGRVTCIFVTIPVLLMDISDMWIIITVILITSIVSIVSSFIIRKETRDLALI